MSNETPADRLRRRCDAVADEVIAKYGEDPMLAISTIAAGLSMLKGHGLPTLRCISAMLVMLADMEQEEEPSDEET